MSTKLDEATFKSTYIATFLATYAANNYADCCIKCDHEIIEKPPVEDADHLANAAWEHWQSIMGK